MKLSSILRTLLSRAAWAALAVTPLVQAAPVIQHWQTAGGARVYFVESRALPIVDVQVDFRAAGTEVPAGKAGLAGLTRGLLDAGAGNLDVNDPLALVKALPALIPVKTVLLDNGKIRIEPR